MMHIVLVSCGKKKYPKKIKAENLYISDLFMKSLNFAKSLNPDSIFILSAKHGLLPLHREIDPYDKTLNKMKTKEIKEWSEEVINQINNICDIEKTNFTILAGIKYYKYLLPHLKTHDIPLKGLTIGKQLQKLKELNK